MVSRRRISFVHIHTILPSDSTIITCVRVPADVEYPGCRAAGSSSAPSVSAASPSRSCEQKKRRRLKSCLSRVHPWKRRNKIY